MLPVNWKTALAGKTILVTGARGYLGSALTAMLVRHCGASVLGMSRQPFTPYATAKAVVGDIRHPDAWAAVGSADIIFHLAGETSTYTAEENPAASIEANVLPMIHLLNACRHRGRVPSVIFAGTATEVGIPEKLPVNDAFADEPITLYDLHKLTAERHLALAVSRGWVTGGTLRLANVYGPSMTAAGSGDRGILNQVIKRALDGRPITIFGDGSQLRDYIYIDDVIQAFVAAAASAAALQGGHYLVGSGATCPFGAAFRLAAQAVEGKIGRPVPIEERPWPSGTSAIEFRNFQADSSRFTGLTGWRPTTSLEDGIRMTIEAFA